VIICGFLRVFPVSSNNKTDRHDITEILLKVVLNTIKPNQLLKELLQYRIKTNLVTSIVHLTSLSEVRWLGSQLLLTTLRFWAILLTTVNATSLPTVSGNLCKTLWLALSHCISPCSDAHSQYIFNKQPTIKSNHNTCTLLNKGK
jgi:hypothetical protein